MSSRIALYFVSVFGLTWLVQLPAVLAAAGVISGPVERYLPLCGIGGLCPLIVALRFARREPERGGVRGLLGPAGARGVHPLWYALALFGAGALFLAGRAVYGLAGGAHGGPWLYLPREPERIVAMVVFPIGEEVGWRGYALPRMQARLGALRASVYLGVLWALWHLFMFLSVGGSFSTLLAMIPYFVSGSVLFTWLYNRTRGALIIAVLAHMGVHLNNTNRALPGDFTPVAIQTLSFAVAALALVARDRTLGASRLEAATGEGIVTGEREGSGPG